MVRAWHPRVIPILDEERLTANHAESHMMMNAIDGAASRPLTDRIGWWSHPETQVWAEAPGALALLHELTVEEMAYRGYKSGADHQTRTIFVPRPIPPVLGLAEIRYKTHDQEWVERDYADLFAKWDKEDRWDSAGYAMLGRRISCKTFVDAGSLLRGDCPTCQPKYRRHRPADHQNWWWREGSDDRERTHRDFLKPYHDKVGPRELVPYDSAGLSVIAATRRKRMVDSRQPMP